VPIGQHPESIAPLMRTDLWEDLRLFGLIWAWLFLGNVAVALIRFPAFLRRSVVKGSSHAV
jgi:hypothetical protein